MSDEIGPLDWLSIVDLIKKKHKLERFSVKYIDEENEEVVIDSQIELDAAYEISSLTNSSFQLKTIIKDMQGNIIDKLIINQPAPSPPTHSSISSYSSSLSSANLSSKAFVQDFNIFKDDVFKMLKQFDKRLEQLAGKIDLININSYKIDALSNNATHDINSIATTTTVSTSTTNVMTEEEKDEFISITAAATTTTTTTANSTPSILDMYHNVSINDYETLKLLTQTLLDQLDQMSNAYTQHISNGQDEKLESIKNQLLSLNSINAAFVRDDNVPDGTKFEPNILFTKCWLVKNCGKLNWSENKIELVNTAGDIECKFKRIFLDNQVDTDETVNIQVDLVSPSKAGIYYSEWVLMCQSFVFGPRIWCKIEVIDDNLINVSDNKKIVRQESCVTEENENDDDESKIEQSSRKGSLFEDLKKNFSLEITDDEDDDDDEEFVVIPDCFDLTKEWKPTDAELFSNLNKTDELFLSNSIDWLINEMPVKETKVTAPPPSVAIEDKDSIQVLTTIHHAIDADEEASINNNDLEVISDTEFSSVKTIDLASIQTVKEQKKEDECLNVALKREQEKYEESLRAKQKSNNKTLHLINKNFTDEWLLAEQKRKEECLRKLSEENKKKEELTARISLYEQLTIINNTPPKKSIVETPMDRLISMGFANRNLNKKLLDKYNNQVEKVIEDLVNKQDNNWADSRH